MLHILEDFKAFLDESPSSWHATTQIANRLASQDFIPLMEDEKWELELGQKYFVIRGGSLCAFCLPSSIPKSATILASHTDSPSLKLKPQPEIIVDNMVLLGVEVYGAPLLTSWLNRDLGVAGRVVVTNSDDKVVEHLVFLDDTPLVIPQLAIHLDREVNEKGLHLNKQDHLNALLTISNDPDQKDVLEKMLRTQLCFKSLLSFDLFLVPLESARYIGNHGEMLAAAHLDNLASAHACATAIGSAKAVKKHAIQMAIFYDHEEIGSRSMEGAASPFLSDILKRIGFAFHLNEELMIRLKHNSLCVSVDMSHALHPNYPKKHDPNHQPLLGCGIILKHNADQRYATTALTASEIVRACQELRIKYQQYVCRSDIPCGSTVGPILSYTMGMPTVDIGCPQLSMHGIREVMATQDHLDMCQLLTHLLEDRDLP